MNDKPDDLIVRLLVYIHAAINTGPRNLPSGHHRPCCEPDSSVCGGAGPPAAFRSRQVSPAIPEEAMEWVGILAGLQVTFGRQTFAPRALREAVQAFFRLDAAR